MGFVIPARDDGSLYDGVIQVAPLGSGKDIDSSVTRWNDGRRDAGMTPLVVKKNVCS
ncbi:MAG: hypothetical protein LBJ80_02630 [Rickettsiales bacterium]|nr:hypothetical protein [Rickettsiales bacterium]MDR1261296.1 hypothetical protein [Rickettsiales bacterium]